MSLGPLSWSGGCLQSICVDLGSDTIEGVAAAAMGCAAAGVFSQELTAVYWENESRRLSCKNESGATGRGLHSGRIHFEPFFPGSLVILGGGGPESGRIDVAPFFQGSLVILLS